MALLLLASRDFSTYSGFEEARKSGDLVKVVGLLDKSKEIVYDPVKDANFFSFYLTDKKAETQKVVLLAPKPQDFELSEQIVLTGKMGTDYFEAKSMLLKCPSKYKDEEILIKSTAER